MIIASQKAVLILLKFIVEKGITDFFGEADDKTKIMCRGKTIILGLFGRVARAPKRTETT